jgi:uroporphyrinogen-III synthase
VTGQRVALVKSAGRADAFAEAVRGVGMVPVLVSPFREEQLDPDPADVAFVARADAARAWIAVTSPHAVPALERWRKDIPLAGLHLAAVGAGTATALQAAGFRPEVVGDAGGAALARRMLDAGLRRGDPVVHPCGEESRHELADVLATAGVRVLAVAVYRMVPDPVGERAAQGAFAAVVVGSPRLAHRASELFRAPRPPAIAIGRTTAAALRDLGWTPAAVAATPTPQDVAAALRAAVV